MSSFRRRSGGPYTLLLDLRSALLFPKGRTLGHRCQYQFQFPCLYPFPEVGEVADLYPFQFPFLWQVEAEAEVVVGNPRFLFPFRLGSTPLRKSR